MSNGSGNGNGNGRMMITKETGISIGIFVMVLIWGVHDATLKTHIQRDIVELKTNSIDRWSKSQMRLWTERAERDNPGWNAPSVDDIPPPFTVGR